MCLSSLAPVPSSRRFQPGSIKASIRSLGGAPSSGIAFCALVKQERGILSLRVASVSPLSIKLALSEPPRTISETRVPHSIISGSARKKCSMSLRRSRPVKKTQRPPACEARTLQWIFTSPRGCVPVSRRIDLRAQAPRIGNAKTV